VRAGIEQMKQGSVGSDGPLRRKQQGAMIDGMLSDDRFAGRAHGDFKFALQ
jgi:hypothetical protein